MFHDEVPPVTRERIFSLMAGFKSTAVLRAAIEVGIFDAFSGGPAGAAQISEALGVDERGVLALLAALAGLGLLTTSGDRYDLAPGTEELLVTASPAYCGGIARVAASDMEWAALGGLGGAIRHGGLADNTLAPDHPYWVDFAAQATFVTKTLAGVVTSAVSVPAGGSVLDVGCGPGILGFTVMKDNPQASLFAQDWPSVLAVAEQHAKRLDVTAQTTFVPGDAFTVDLHGPHDVIIAGNLLFHFSPEQAGALLDRLIGALKPDGVLVIAGFTSGDHAPQEETHAALLGLLMLTTTPGGRIYSTDDYRRMLTSRGLTAIEVHTRPGLLPRVITARCALH